jgi:26S proteasome regulatory subunit N6
MSSRLTSLYSQAVKGSANYLIVLKQVITSFSSEDDPEDSKYVELAVADLANFYIENHDTESLFKLQVEIRQFYGTLPRAKTAKIVRFLIDSLAKLPNTEKLQISACVDCINFCIEEKRAFLRQRIELKLAALYLQQHKYTAALELLGSLVTESRKMEDKLLLVEALVLETKVHFSLKNISKSKASLTAAKANANSIHCPVLLQAEIDLISGSINLRENDHKTGYSYFYEAYEALNNHMNIQIQQGHSDISIIRVIDALKYMMLAKILNNSPDEAIVARTTRGFPNVPVLDGLCEVAKNQKAKSLMDYERTLKTYDSVFSSDLLLSHHLKELNESLLEQNLLKLIIPYSKIELAFLASLIKLSEERVVTKLSEMILDRKISGTIDQGVGVLIVFDQEDDHGENDTEFYDDVLEILQNTSQAIDALSLKSQKILA